MLSNQLFQNRSTTPNEAVISSDRTRTTTTTSPLSSTTTASLILLKPLSSKSQYTKATSINKVSFPYLTDDKFAVF